GTLRTAPAGAGAFSFAASGDQGTDARARAVLGLLQASDPAFVFCLGDLCYADPSGGLLPRAGVDHAVWDRWLGMFSRAVAAGAALLPVVGNHEIESGMGDWGYDGFLARFSLPPGGVPGLPTTWVGRWGNLALVAADSNDVSTEITLNNGLSGGRQDRWLEETLAGLRADPTVDWIVVGFHHSAYCTNSLHGSDGGVRRWGPIFDRHEVDLVLNGHNHCYERTHPMRAGMAVTEVRSGQARWVEGAVTYLCAGGGGGQTGFPMWRQAVSTVTGEGGVRQSELAPWSAYRYNGHSLVLVDVSPPAADTTTALTIRALDAAGSDLERVTLLRRR
ncbi:MAG: metallophosphoesterase family protein, partial [Acidimicrobiia bacterium]